MTNFESKLSKGLYDNVHGFVKLTEEEKKLLESPYFQRLNHIKQLGLAYFVFPGAVHTRFSHSLGVLHIAEKMICQINKKQENLIDDRMHQIIRLAALLHDIGHYPLSHTVEKSYMEHFAYASVLKKELCKNKLTNLFKYYDYDRNQMHHEEMASIIIKSSSFQKLLTDLFRISSDEIDAICKIITGSPINDDYYIPTRLIHSKFDADQIDYMLRDKFNTGFSSFLDIDFIIGNIDICNKVFEGGKQLQSISFNIKAVQAIEQFILAKYYWYSSILYHDKTYIINLIAQRLYTYMLSNNMIDADYSNIDGLKALLENNPNKFFFFNDNYFWNRLYEILYSQRKKHPKIITKLAEMLVKRNFPEIMNSDFYEQHFDNKDKISPLKRLCEKEENPSNNILEKKIRKLNKQQGNYYIGIPIEKSILSLDDNEKNDLENEDINIHIDNKKCKNIIDLNNQFLQAFIYENKSKQKKSKCIRAAIIYDFNNIF